MPRTLLCPTLFIVAIGAAACSDGATTPLAVPEGALFAASSSSGLCTYDGSADYLIQIRIRNYCPASVLEQMEDDLGTENTFWFTGDEDVAGAGEEFEIAETTASLEPDDREAGKKCLIGAGGKIIWFSVPSHVDCPLAFRRIPKKPIK
jgi:hypothetical protein